MAITFKQALRRIWPGLEAEWEYFSLIRRIAEIKLDETTSDDLKGLELVCNAFLKAIRAERYEKAGLIVDEPSDQSPVGDWDNSYTLRDKFTGRVLHIAEPYAMNEGTIRDLNARAGSEWCLWISGSEALCDPGHTLAVACALKKDCEKGFPRLHGG